ncbi:sulfite exporter TauE/SafE family protein [Catenovulum agarivorans]|uniref:sulfite exporter TauE/SafE family protein n=1 Tax=Catenovulum agarivorans TaxID=1172192 RepID=UPI00030B0EC0|nr:sulfite exporter TauE/SafE family protein [Catenovulum agarivorans]
MQIAALAGSSIGLSLGIFGSGGAVLAVPVLICLAGMSAKDAVVNSLFIVAWISLFTLIVSKSWRNVNWRIALLLASSGFVGSFAGVYLAELSQAWLQLLVFAVLLLVASVFMWRSPKNNQSHPAASSLLVFPIGLFVGGLTGFSGVGGGFLLVPTLVLLAKLDFFQARATSLALIAFNASVGFIQYQTLSSQSYQLDWVMIGVLAGLGGLGAVWGQKWSAKWPQDKLRKSFAVFLLLLGSFILINGL